MTSSKDISYKKHQQTLQDFFHRIYKDLDPLQESTRRNRTALLARKMRPRTKTETPQRMSFLALPPEIRNLIYENLLISVKPTVPQGFLQVASPSYPSFSEYRSILAIACTCKQIKAETLSIYFGMNTFKLGSIMKMKYHLDGMGKTAQGHLRRIEFSYNGHIRIPAFQLLATCPNLEYLHIIISKASTRGSRGDQKDLFKANGLKQLKEVRGYKEVVVVYEKESSTSPSHFDDAHVNRFEEMLKMELGKPRGMRWRNRLSVSNTLA